MKKNNSKSKPKISYDKESQVLSLEVGQGKSADSDIRGNFVIDYDRQGKIVRVSLYNFDFDAFRDNGKVLNEFARESKVAVSVR